MSRRYEPEVSRRELLKLSAAGFVGASVSGWLHVMAGHAAQGAAAGVKHKSCILLYMLGGASHLDTFDLKPDAPAEVRGEFQPIPTSAPGIQISEHFPQFAKLMQHAAIIRSMSTEANDHFRGSYLAHRGYPVGAGALQHPTLGCIVSAELGQPDFPLPNFVACGHNVEPKSFGKIIDSGYLGPKYQGLAITDLKKGVEDLKPLVDADEFGKRVSVLDQLEQAFQGTYQSGSAEAHRTNYQRAVQLIRSSKTKAFDLSLEPASGRDAYGNTDFGRGCLLARRLVEVGVPFVEVGMYSWDTHGQNFPRVKSMSAIVDTALSALVRDLAERGLLERTLVIWMGEFGRTPKINNKAGRDHYNKAWSTVLVGGIKGGRVVGRTDQEGAVVEERPVSTRDFMATICKVLGIDYTKSYSTPGGRPVHVVEQGAKPIAELLA